MTTDLILLALFEEEERRIRSKVIRPHCADVFSLPENEFIKLFRLNKHVAAELIEKLRPALQPRTYRRNAFSVETKVFTALRFFGSGSYQSSISNDIHISMAQQSASNCIRQVADAINEIMFQEYIYFPSSPQELAQIKLDFYQYCQLPGVIGAIDCTHVAIIAPPDDDHHMERNFVNRKNFHSINVQIVSDNNLKILNINAKFPGSTHDAFIWRASNLKTLLSQITFKDCWLLGDSGYPLQFNMLTPFDAPSTSAQRRYNNAHTRGRCVIERLNGVLKSRFRCLRKHRTLSYMPRSAARIINACAVLHNMCIEEDLFFEDDLDDEDDLAFDTGLSTTTSHTSATLRDRIAANFA
ncbi:hypothetical protein JTE90_024776 [Oedothorax gibbosus]|uniref:Putative nuclease HARBI1 n=1 Tax=Oedothorax gibbosus TaxID=931172 RepID=A0AAV6UAH3_9ARAC|nr:hypothetical protein JTE90_024776 [Oedothorax gibbosus]